MTSGTVELSADACYRALRTRDRRFDGRFFVGVRTTGIYCRPICPARTPLAGNCTFYACAAAAQDAGFRPCRRCRPETSPGTPAWLGTSSTVSRALRLIGSGALDGGSVPELAARLGVGDRHLRRLFLRHLGATPQAVARTRRILFARRLLEETDLPMSQLALAAGFTSQRRFNSEVRAAFDASPRELRGARRRVPTDGAALVVRLPYRPPLAWRALLDFLATRAIPGVEAVDGGRYCRSFEFDGTSGVLEVSRDASRDELVARVHAKGTLPLIRLHERLRGLFDLGADPAAIADVLRGDPTLRAHLGRRAIPRVPGAFCGFELAVRAVLGQQVTVRGATTLAGRLIERFGRPLPHAPLADGPVFLFPTADALADVDLRGLGMPDARARALRSLARAVAKGELALDPGTDPARARAALCAIPGIGPWTAEYVAMRALGEPDAFPESDLGLRRALGRPGALATPAQVRRAGDAWRPWRSYACIALWNAA